MAEIRQPQIKKGAVNIRKLTPKRISSRSQLNVSFRIVRKTEDWLESPYQPSKSELDLAEGIVLKFKKEGSSTTELRSFTDEPSPSTNNTYHHFADQSLLQPETLSLILSVVASSSSIAKVILNILHSKPKTGPHISEIRVEGAIITGNMNPEDVIKIIRAVRKKKKGK